MVRQKAKRFDEYLKTKLRDKTVRKHYKQARLAVELARQMVVLREKLGISQAELARRMGTKQQTISRLESGAYDGFTLRTLMKIADATKTQLVVSFRPTRSSRAV